MFVHEMLNDISLEIPSQEEARELLYSLQAYALHIGTFMEDANDKDERRLRAEHYRALRLQSKISKIIPDLPQKKDTIH